MKSERLLQWYISTNIMFLENIHRPVYTSKHNVSETVFCLCLHVKPTQLGPIDRASPYHVLPEDGERIQCPKRYVLKYKQDGIFDKCRTMNIVQKHI
jgi:hypothetical protein